MNNRILLAANVALITAATALAIPAAAFAQSAPAAGEAAGVTEDILFMVDGRELHGEIVSETPTEIIFRFVDPGVNIEVTLNIARNQIAKIDRDVAVAGAAADDGGSDSGGNAWAPPSAGGDKKSNKEELIQTYGAHRSSSNPEAPSFYVVPMKGQMGTDVNEDVYRDMIDDIRAKGPDYLVIELFSRDTEEDRLYSRIEQEDKSFDGSTFLDEYREVVNIFRDELGDIPQVLWIHDSVGISSVIAFAWDQMYMKPEAHLGGISGVQDNFNVQDPEVYAKFREAYMAWLRGFAEYGNYDIHLIDAMVLPDFKLSASWEGRNVEWKLDDTGDYLVDGSDEDSTEFRAKAAEDFSLTDGTAETLDDLALLLGLREYQVLDSEGQEIFDKYVENWRRMLDNCKEWFEDAQKFLGWANGEDTLKYLGQAKNMYERMLSAMDRYRAVEIRLATDLGINRQFLITQIEQIREQIRALRSRDSGRGGGGRGAPGPGGGAGSG